LLVPALVVCACSIVRYGEEAARFDDDLPAFVASRTVTDEFGEKVTLVRAAINGEELGWFLLSSGSYFCVIDAGYVAKVEKLSKVSDVEISYPCKLPVAVYRAKAFTVGRLTIKNLNVAAFDLSAMMQSVGEEIVGIVGYPVFAHSVVRIEYGSGGTDDRVSVYDPGSFRMDDADWQPLGLYNLQPVMTGRVNRQHEALFAIETGAACTVSFYSVFAAARDLLEGSPATEKTVHTVCGESTERESAVRVFEIGGNTYDRLPVSIMNPGSITDVAPGRLGGIVGRNILHDFDVVFDLSNEKIALIRE